MMKKLSLAAACLLLAAALLLSACSHGSVTTDPSQADGTNIIPGETVTFQSNNVITPATNPGSEQTTVLVADPNTDPLDAIGKEAQIFRSGKVYFEGAIFSEDGSNMPVIFASDGHNVQINVTTDGLAMGVVVIDGTTYLLLPSSRMYAEISDRLMSALGLDSFDLTSISQMTSEGLEDNSTQVKSYAVTINGENGLCTEFDSPDNDTISRLYTLGDKLVQCDTVEKATGKVTMQVAFTSVSAAIPADMLTLKGYEKASSAYSFLKSLVQN